MTEIKFQIGKNGVTPGVIQSLNLIFKKHRKARISVLKNAARDKAKVREMAEELAAKLEGKFNYRIIGFTIIMIKSMKN